MFWVDNFDGAYSTGYEIDKTVLVDHLRTLRTEDYDPIAIVVPDDPLSPKIELYLRINTKRQYAIPSPVDDKGQQTVIAEETMVFWLLGFNGPCSGGCYIRKYGLVDFIYRLKADGFNPVAISVSVDPDDSNIEVYLEINDKYTEHFEEELMKRINDNI